MMMVRVAVWCRPVGRRKQEVRWDAMRAWNMSGHSVGKCVRGFGDWIHMVVLPWHLEGKDERKGRGG